MSYSSGDGDVVGGEVLLLAWMSNSYSIALINGRVRAEKCLN